MCPKSADGPIRIGCGSWRGPGGKALDGHPRLAAPERHAHLASSGQVRRRQIAPFRKRRLLGICGSSGLQALARPHLSEKAPRSCRLRKSPVHRRGARGQRLMDGLRGPDAAECDSIVMTWPLALRCGQVAVTARRPHAARRACRARGYGITSAFRPALRKASTHTANPLRPAPRLKPMAPNMTPDSFCTMTPPRPASDHHPPAAVTASRT